MLAKSHCISINFLELIVQLWISIHRTNAPILITFSLPSYTHSNIYAYTVWTVILLFKNIAMHIRLCEWFLKTIHSVVFTYVKRPMRCFHGDTIIYGYEFVQKCEWKCFARNPIYLNSTLDFQLKLNTSCNCKHLESISFICMNSLCLL